MARAIKNSRVNPQAIDSHDAYNRGQNRKEDLDRDLKVQQIHDQPGRGRRPGRRIRQNAPK